MARECDRISKHTSREDRLALHALDSPLNNATDSHNSFASLYADALLHLGLIILRDPGLAAKGEPDSVKAYLHAALDVLKGDYPDPTASAEDTRLHSTWSTILSILADPETSSEDLESVPKYLGAATEHYTLAHTSAAPFQVVTPNGEDSAPRLPQLTKAGIDSAYATLVSNACWQVPAPERKAHLSKAVQAALEAEKAAVLPQEDEVLFHAVFTHGRIQQDQARELLPEGFEDNGAAVAEPVAEEARDLLQQGTWTIHCGLPTRHSCFQNHSYQRFR